MKIEDLDLIANFIHSMRDNDAIVRIIKQNNAIRFENEDLRVLFDGGDIRSFYTEYKSDKMTAAYEPFLGVIKSVIKSGHLDVNEVLNEVDAYSLNRSLFLNYLDDKPMFRKESPILVEKNYDEERFVNDLINILLYLSLDKDIFIILNEVNQIGDSSLEVLNRLANMNSSSLKILMLTNEMGSIKRYVFSKYKDFMQKSEEKGLVYDWPFEGFVEHVSEKAAYIMENSLDELERISDMVSTFAFTQAKYYLEIIYRKVEIDKVEVESEYRISMLRLYIIVSIFTEDYSYALILCQKIHHLGDNEIDRNEREFLYYYYKGMANMYIGNEEESKKNAEKCYTYACEIDDEFKIFRGLLLVHMAKISGWVNIWMSVEDGVDPKLLEYLYKYEYLNHLAHIYVYYYENDCSLYTKVEGIEDRIPYNMKGINITLELKNEFFLVEAYKMNVMMASYSGCYNVANYFYKKLVQLMRRTSNKFEQANIYNGLGYNSCSMDKYMEANRYYNKALRIFVDEKSSDYIMETLYNMGTNAILAGNYVKASEFLTSVVNIIVMLKKNRLRVCNISKIFGLIAVASFKQGNYYLTQIFYKKAKYFLSHILEYRDLDKSAYLWDDDLFLFYYVSALLAEKKEDIEEAIAFYDKAEVYMNQSAGTKFINLSLYAEDRASFYRKIGRDEEAIALLKNARDFYSENGNVLCVKRFEDLIHDRNWAYPSINMDMTDTTLDEIMQYIKVESIEKDAITRKNNIKFFGAFQEVINQRYSDIDSMIDILITNFKNNFNLDNILFVMCDDGEAEVKYTDLGIEISKEEVEEILDYFRSNTSGFVVSKFSDNAIGYEKILKIFNKIRMFAVVGVPFYKNEKLLSFFIAIVRIPDNWYIGNTREVLDGDDIEIYTIVFRYILDAIEKYKLNDELQKQAVTDGLTDLYNRKGYYEKIENMIKAAKKSNRGINCACIYIDLDHFKYYNDTYGHHVGDAILIKFANIFREVCGDKGHVFRFGGDEFVMLLNTSDENVVRDVAEKIYGLIEQEDGFETLVSKYVDTEVKIPMEARATCSMGAEVGIELTTAGDITKMERNADSALYYVKESGRGRFMMYREMKELTE